MNIRETRSLIIAQVITKMVTKVISPQFRPKDIDSRWFLSAGWVSRSQLVGLDNGIKGARFDRFRFCSSKKASIFLITPTLVNFTAEKYTVWKNH